MSNSEFPGIGQLSAIQSVLNESDEKRTFISGLVYDMMSTMDNICSQSKIDSSRDTFDNILLLALVNDNSNMDNPKYQLMISALKLNNSLDNLYDGLRDSGGIEWLGADKYKGSDEEGRIAGE